MFLAIPVVADSVAEALCSDCDSALFLATPKDLISVGMYFNDFHQLRDEEVKQLLNRAWADLPAR
jgi:putative phosphoribosyl transferase